MSFERKVRRGDTAKEVLIALGSNVGDSEVLVRAAMRRLREFADGEVTESSLWRSSPVDCPPGSPPFINATAAFTPKPGVTPESLLARLQELETEFGRRPKLVPNEPRPLDLDLIAFGQQTRKTAQLTLPHPRAHLRRFVLEPLNEIAPDYVLPGQEKTVRGLLEDLASDEVVTRLLA